MGKTPPRPMRHTLFLAFLVLTSTAAAQTAPDVAGCYRIALDREAPWPDSLAHLQNPATLPDRVELTDEPFTITMVDSTGAEEEVRAPGMEHARRVRYPLAPDHAGPFRLWSGRGGHVGLSQYMPMGGLRILAETERGGALVGTVVSSTDAIGDWANSVERPVRLEREPCPGR